MKICQVFLLSVFSLSAQLCLNIHKFLIFNSILHFIIEPLGFLIEINLLYVFSINDNITHILENVLLVLILRLEQLIWGVQIMCKMAIFLRNFGNVMPFEGFLQEKRSCFVHAAEKSHILAVVYC